MVGSPVQPLGQSNGVTLIAAKKTAGCKSRSARVIPSAHCQGYQWRSQLAITASDHSVSSARQRCAQIISLRCRLLHRAGIVGHNPACMAQPEYGHSSECWRDAARLGALNRPRLHSAGYCHRLPLVPLRHLLLWHRPRGCNQYLDQRRHPGLVARLAAVRYHGNRVSPPR